MFKEQFEHLLHYLRWPVRVDWVHSGLSNYDIELCLEARKLRHVFILDIKMKEMLTGAIESSLIACIQDQLWNDFYSSKFKA